jgi:hypothetical protein
MDASAILAALANGDVNLFLAELDFDERAELTLSDGRPAIVGRVGTYAVIWSEATGLDVHDHGDETDAINCQAWKLDLMRVSTADATFARMLPEVRADLDSLDNTYEGRHVAPDQGYWI